jgi:hypothetical protein
MDKSDDNLYITNPKNGRRVLRKGKVGKEIILLEKQMKALTLEKKEKEKEKESEPEKIVEKEQNKEPVKIVENVVEKEKEKKESGSKEESKEESEKEFESMISVEPLCINRKSEPKAVKWNVPKMMIGDTCNTPNTPITEDSREDIEELNQNSYSNSNTFITETLTSMVSKEELYSKRIKNELVYSFKN